MSESLLERAFTDGVAPEDTRDPRSEVLDAAYELFCHFGTQRTTMEDVARKAGLSRITVYRRVASKEALVELVVLREFRRYFDQFLLAIAPARTVGDRVVAGFAHSIRAVKDNPLISGLMSTEPELMAPNLLGAGGSTMAVVAEFLTGQLGREQQAGNLAPEVDVEAVADLMVRISTSFILTPGSILDLTDDEALAAFARCYLVPLLTTPAWRTR